MFVLGCAAGALAFAVQPYDLRFLIDYVPIRAGFSASTASQPEALPKLDSSLVTGSIGTPAAATNLVLRPSMPADVVEGETPPTTAAAPAGAKPEPVSAAIGNPGVLCDSLTAAGFHGAEWQRGGNGEWSCTPDVERAGRDGASLFATILGEDAETVSLVRLKLNLISETANDGIKRRAASLIQSFARDLGWNLPPEAEQALITSAAYQFSDNRWQFIVRPQENDPARVNVFLRRVAAQKIDMRGGL